MPIGQSDSFDATPLEYGGLVNPKYSCRVEVFRWDTSDVFADLFDSPINASNQVYEINNVISCDVTNTHEGVCSFNLALPASDKWMTKITPDDFMLIHMDDGILGENPQIMGNVDRVYPDISVDQQTGAARSVVRVTGRGHIKQLQETDIVSDVSLNSIAESEITVAQYKNRLAILIGKGLEPGTSNQILYNLYLALVNPDLLVTADKKSNVLPQWLFPGSSSTIKNAKPFYQYIKMFFDTTYGFSMDPQIVLSARNLWALMGEWANRPFNELFTEVYSKTVIDLENRNSAVDWKKHVYAVVHRERPYLKSAFRELPYVRVRSTVDVLNPAGLGFSSSVRKNYFRVTPAGSWDKDPLVISSDSHVAIADMESMSRYGVRRMEVGCRYPFPDPNRSGNPFNNFSDPVARLNHIAKISGDAFTILSTNTRKLALWYYNEHAMMNGSLRCRLIPKVKLGYRLIWSDDIGKRKDTVYNDDEGEYHFYIEGYTKSYQYPNGSSMEIAVSRGVPKSELYRTRATRLKFLGPDMNQKVIKDDSVEPYSGNSDVGKSNDAIPTPEGMA